MGLWNLIVRFFQGGGDFMYPIAIVFVVGLAIAIERYIYLTAAAARNRGLWNEIVPLLAQGNFRQAVQVTSKSNAAIGQILHRLDQDGCGTLATELMLGGFAHVRLSVPTAYQIARSGGDRVP